MKLHMCAEYLSRDGYEIVCTLQHEMVHYANKIAEIKDCNGQVHNKKFKKAAEAVGLIVDKSKKYGFGHTTCSEEFKAFIDESIKLNMECFSYFRNAPLKESTPKEKTQFTYICPQCEEKIKAKADKNIICGECNVEFEMQE